MFNIGEWSKHTIPVIDQFIGYCLNFIQKHTETKKEVNRIQFSLWIYIYIYRLWSRWHEIRNVTSTFFVEVMDLRSRALLTVDTSLQ